MRGNKDRSLNVVKYIKILYVIQVVIFLSLITYRLSNNLGVYNEKIDITVDIILSLLAFLMLLNGYLFIKDIIHVKKQKIKTEMREEAYENVRKLNRDLRIQRHDFLNHIHVIYSLLELEEYDDCREYLNDLYGDIGKLSENIKTNKIAINALLQAKSNEAENLLINYRVIIRSALDRLIIPEWEVCRCIGNLIDNAFHATIEAGGEKAVTVVIEENLLHYVISVVNNGKEIENEIVSKIFEQGFTTKIKNKKEHGMGLYIVRQITKRYKSDIEVITNNQNTTFIMKIPKEMTV